MPADLGRTAEHVPEANRVKPLDSTVKRVDTDEQTAVRTTAPIQPDPNEFPGYRLVGEIARGGMGVVLDAEDLKFGRRVAIKTLLRGEPGSDAARRFVTEARITGQLQHPGVPPVHELGTLPDGRPFLAMKFIKGRTLAALLKERPDPGHEVPQFVQVFDQICQAVGYAHAQSVIHRDLKPLNVMVGAFSEVQVMDWGLAKQVGSGPGAVSGEENAGSESLQSGSAETNDQTRAGSVMGTPAFMSPEQARGEIENLGPATDVFALWAILCQILTGKPPYVGTTAEMVSAAARADLGFATAALDACDADAELVALAKRCMSANPADRPKDAGEVANLVAAYRAGVEERLRKAQTQHAAAKAKAAELRKRRRVQFALVTAVLLLAAGTTAYLWSEDRRASRLEAVKKQQEHDATLRAEAHRVRMDSIGNDIDRLLDEGATALRASDAARATRPITEAEGRLKEYQGELPQDRFTAANSRASMLRFELNMVRELDRLDDLRWSVSAGKVYTTKDVVTLWPEVFHNYGLNLDHVGSDGVPVAAERIRNSPARDRMLAALDLWLTESSVNLLPLLHAIDPDPYRDTVRAAAKAKDWNRVTALLTQKEAVEQPPQFAIVLAKLAGLNDGNRARILQAIHHKHPTNFSVLMTLAGSFPRSPKYAAEQVGWYRAAVSVRPTSPAAWNDLGVALAASGDLEGAKTAYLEALKHDEKLAHAHDNLGTLYGKLGKVREALEAHRHALALEPDHPAAHLNLSSALHEAGDYPGAIAAARAALKIHPRDAKAFNNLAMALHATKDFRGAITAYLKAIEFDLDLYNPHYNLGNLYAERGDNIKAISCFREAIRLDPSIAEVHTNLANALTELERHEDAVASYRRALELKPDLPEAPVGLCNALVETGDFPAAVIIGKDAVRLNPKSAIAHIAFARALFEVGEFDEAARHVKLGRGLQPNDKGIQTLAKNLLEDIAGAKAADANLPAIAAGKAKPASLNEAIELADVCGKYRQRYALAVSLARMGFANPRLKNEDIAHTPLRFEAAGYAVQAAAGRGIDPPAEAGRAAFRKQALDWLRADLAVWKQDLAQDAGIELRNGLNGFMGRWLRDRNLAPVRDPDQLAELPEEEQLVWRAFWKDVRALRDLTTTRTPAPPPRSGKK